MIRRNLGTRWTLRVACVLVGLLALTGCKHRAATMSWNLSAIDGVPGPEDMVREGDARLLISSNHRRVDGPGEIYAYDFKTGTVRALPRLEEPDDLSFHPHGIDLVMTDDGDTQLYVISHRKSGDGPAHEILIYDVFLDELVFRESLSDPLLVSPNDLTVHPDGTLYVTNDRSNPKNWNEVILGQKRSRVLSWDGDTWTVRIHDLAMANGIAYFGDQLLVSATRENAVYVYDISDYGELGHKQLLATITGPDNIVIDGHHALVAAHEKMTAFMGHSKSASNLSPSSLYRIDLRTGETELIFADDGSSISAASVGVLHDGKLYLGQVFEAFVVEATPYGAEE